MSISFTGAGVSEDISTDNTITDNLPEGDTVFVPPAGILVSGSDVREDTPSGIQASGEVTADGAFVSSSAILLYNEQEIATTALGDTLYSVTGTPVGVEQGESALPRNELGRIRITTESGGISSTTFSDRTISYFVDFGTLTVTVLDANGDPVSGEQVTSTAGLSGATNSSGEAVFQAAGTDTVTALAEMVSKQVTVPEGGTASLTFQYAGVEGAVSFRGNPVTGATVIIRDDTGATFDSMQTDDETGDYSFDTIPPNVTDWSVEVGEATTGLATRDGGLFVTRRITEDDFNVTTATAIVTCEDANTGERIVGLTVSSGLANAVTGPQGRGVVLVPASEETDVVVDGGGRYEDGLVSFTVSTGNQEQQTLQLAEETNTGNTA